MSTSSTADRVTAHFDTLRESLAALVTGAQWLEFLDVQARFPTYSFHNTLAILAQAPHATRVAGYRTWHTVGRHVRQGEHGIAILAPIVRRRDDTNATAAETSAIDHDSSDSEHNRCVGFRVVHVFDIAQTDGDPLPTGPTPHLLTGHTPAELWPALVTLISQSGYRTERAPMPDWCPTANGVTLPDEQLVIVRDDVPDAQAIKTCAHELAHVLLHTTTSEDRQPRPVREIEAESVAYLVCAAHGMDPSGYSFAYLAHWSGGNLELVAATGTRVIGCARYILDHLTTDPSAS